MKTATERKMVVRIRIVRIESNFDEGVKLKERKPPELGNFTGRRDLI